MYPDQKQKNQINEIKVNQDYYLNETKAIYDLTIELEELTLLGYAWNKIYNVAFLKSIGALFQSITMIEDILFNVEVFHSLGSLNVLSITPYHYMKRGTSSLTNKYLPDYYILHRRRIEAVYELYVGWYQWEKDIPDRVKQILGARYVRYIYSAMMRNHDHRAAMGSKERVSFLSDVYKDKLYQSLQYYAASDRKVEQLMIQLIRRQCMFVLILARLMYIAQTCKWNLYTSLKKL